MSILMSLPFQRTEDMEDTVDTADTEVGEDTAAGLTEDGGKFYFGFE